MLAGVLGLLGAMTAVAQQGAAPPMNMTPEEMRQMQPTAPAEQSAPPEQPPPDAAREPPRETHASDPLLERPAVSEHSTLAPMPGMDTDMNDAALLHRIWIENFEAAGGTRNGGAWDAQGWLGGDFDKLWIKSEGATLGGKTQDAKVEALWAHAVLPYWDTQLGIRHDFEGGPGREWAAFGVNGISPYWFDVELTGYFGEEGRTALRLKTEYDLYLTERLAVRPEVELNAYGTPDRARDIGAGLSDGEFELRLRYEFSRRVAPYAGYVYDRKFAGSAALARLAGGPALDHRAVAGIECFF